MASKPYLPTHSTKRQVAAEPPETVDVAIIGCGVSSLMAGARLAKQGLSVALFDPHYVAGGCTTQFARGSGDQRYCFDIGLHYLGDCDRDGLIPKLLQSVAVDVEFLPMDPEGFDVFVFPDLTFRFPAHRDLYRQRLVELFPAEKKGIDRYLRLVDEVTRFMSHFGIEGARPGPRLLFHVALHGRLLARVQAATIGEFLDTCTSDERLRAILLGQHGIYALPPSETSALLHAGATAHYLKGGYYPKGGGQVVSDRLVEAIERRGGTIHLRRGVDRILVEKGRAVGVRTEARNGQQHDIRSRAVLSGADLTHTLLDLIAPGDLPPRWRRRTRRFQMAGALFMTYLGVAGDMAERNMGVSNYWQFDVYDFDRAFDRLRAHEQIETYGCYITSASLKDPQTRSHAPAGFSNVEIMCMVDGDPAKWGVAPAQVLAGSYRKQERYRRIKQQLEDDMIERLDRVFPGSAAKVAFRESATPVSHTRFTRAAGGTGYGLASSPEQFGERRPGYRGPIDGMFLCGASTRAGHGIVGAMLGGYQAARIVSDTLGNGRS